MKKRGYVAPARLDGDSLIALKKHGTAKEFAAQIERLRAAGYGDGQIVAAMAASKRLISATKARC